MSNPPFDIILGGAEYAKILSYGLIKGGDGKPMAQNTKFGWILSGAIDDGNNGTHIGSNIVFLISNIELDKKMSAFFCDESFAVKKQDELNDEEQYCIEHHQNKHFRDFNGKYVVTLPFKHESEKPDLGESRKVALDTFFSNWSVNSNEIHN